MIYSDRRGIRSLQIFYLAFSSEGSVCFTSFQSPISFRLQEDGVCQAFPDGPWHGTLVFLFLMYLLTIVVSRGPLRPVAVAMGSMPGLRNLSIPFNHGGERPWRLIELPARDMCVSVCVGRTARCWLVHLCCTCQTTSSCVPDKLTTIRQIYEIFTWISSSKLVRSTTVCSPLFSISLAYASRGKLREIITRALIWFP